VVSVAAGVPDAQQPDNEHGQADGECDPRRCHDQVTSGHLTPSPAVGASLPVHLVAVPG
jgi:hypothetical protein